MTRKIYLHRKQSGFSLLETLLALSVSAVLMLALFQIFEDFADNVMADTTASEIIEINEAVEGIIDSPMAFTDIYGELLTRAPNYLVQLNTNNLVNGFNISGGMIHRASGLNENIRNNISAGSRLSIIIRIGDNPTNANDSESLEILIATNSRIDEEKVKKITTVLGAQGGFYESDDDQIKSAFGTWDIDPNDLDPSNWFTRIMDNPPSQDDGIYLVHAHYKRFDDIVGDYLFKEYIPGRPELNRLYGDLTMTNQPILGVDNIVVSGNATFSSSAYINGDASIQRRARFNESNFIAGQTLTTRDALIEGLDATSPGELMVEGDINANNINLAGDVQSNAVNINNDLRVIDQMTVDGASRFIGDLTVGRRLTSNTIQDISELDITRNNARSEIGPISVGNITRVTGGEFSTDELDVSGNSSVGGLYANRINFNRLNLTGSFGACERGC